MSSRLRFKSDENLGTLPDRAAARFPNTQIDMVRPPDIDPATPACVDAAGFAELVAQTSDWLWEAGLRKGDRVAVMKRNHLDVQVLAGAACRMGALPGLISPAIDPAHARVLLGRFDPSLAVTDTKTWGDGFLDEGAHDSVRTVVIDDTSPTGDRRRVPLKDLRGLASAPVSPVAFDEPMIVTHTSGTTGVPKLVVHSAQTISARSKLQVRRWPLLGVRSGDKYAGAIAWCHARACDGMIAFYHIGLDFLALPDGTPALVEDRFPEFAPTIVEALPNTYVLWEDLATSNRAPFASARMFVGAFDAIHPRTVRRLLDASSRRVPFWVQAYGQSEIGGVALDVYTRGSVRPGRGHARTRSMGWSVPGMTKVRVVDQSGLRVPRGTPGRIEASSAGMALSYLGQEALHTKRRKGDWWSMGDIGVMTRGGRLLLHDREIDQVDGLASCLQIEDVLMDRLAGVSEVVIVRNSEGGATPVVCTYGDAPLDEDAWRAATAGLPPLDPPRRLDWSDVPRTGTLKVRRSVLERQLAAVSGTTREPATSQDAR